MRGIICQTASHVSVHSATALSAMSYKWRHTHTHTHTHTASRRMPQPASASVPTPSPTSLAHINPRCHRQLLRPVLAAPPTCSQLPLAPFASVLPSHQPVSRTGRFMGLVGHLQPYPTAQRLLPSAINACAAQPMDWPHFRPPTNTPRLDSPRVTMRARGLSVTRHTRAHSRSRSHPEVCACLIASTSQSIVASLDATSDGKSDAALASDWANRRALAISRSPLQRTAAVLQTTALLSPRGS